MFSLFSGKRAGSAIVIDIGSSSIGGAFVSFPENEAPLMPFSIREDIEFQNGRHTELSMLRTFESVLNALHDQGRPAFHRASGVEQVDRIFVAVGTPWQETRVEHQVLGEGKSFVFSRELLQSAMKKRQALPEGKKELQNEVVATLLNGYQTADPYGKRADRAEIVFLSSSMGADAMNQITRSVKRFGARHGAFLAPSQSLAHAVLHAQYPHDKDFLLMLVSGEATNVLFANRGIIMDATSIPIGLHELRRAGSASMRTLPVNEGPPEPLEDPAQEENKEKEQVSVEDAWTAGITGVFKEFATRHALPRMVYLVANDGSAASLKRFLDTPEMHALWLSDESLTIIPVVSKLLSSLIRHQGRSDADVMLDLLALFARLKLTPKTA